MTQADIDRVVDAFAKGARDAKTLGFDGVELHGAHGYLIDQFFWEGTNQRADRTAAIWFRAPVSRSRSLRRCAAIGPDFPLVLRWSQWKLQDFEAKLARTPQELELFLRPLGRRGRGRVSLFARGAFGSRSFPEAIST